MLYGDQYNRRERPRGERRESVDFEDRNNHHPLLPSKSDQGTVGGSVWCGVAKESLSFCDGPQNVDEVD